MAGANDHGRSGEHRPGGWLVAAGPGAPAGPLGRTLSPYALAPTLAAMLGMAMAGVDDVPIDELVRVTAP